MIRLAASITALATCAVLGVIAGGCGGSSDPGVAQLGSTSASAAAAPASTTQASPQDMQEAVLAFVRCLRDEGLDVPDPDFSGGGAGARVLLRRGLDPNNPKFRKAQEKCRPLIARIRPQFSPERREEFQQVMLDFANCMRENGVDVPDPDFSGGGPGAGGGIFRGANGLDQNNPKVRKAMDACRHLFTDAGLGPGRGGPAPARP